jgi:hypothetical protein
VGGTGAYAGARGTATGEDHPTAWTSPSTSYPEHLRMLPPRLARGGGGR